MANLTLSVDDAALERARARARAMGTSVNQMVRELIERVARWEETEAEIEAFRRSCLSSGGDSRGWRFNRDELHERS